MFPLLLIGWLSSTNAAGLQTLPDSTRTSQAEVWASVADGAWVNYYASDDSREWGAATRSHYRVDSRVALAGEVSYRNFTGRNMSGSLFIDPTDKPFDFVEWNDGHAGEKQLEEYRLNGAASYGIGRRWSIGAGIDFTSANYAKRRDLRHQNRLMRMTLSPGMTWLASDKMRLGASGIFTREVEGVAVNIAGTADTDYYTMVSYGAFYGIKQLASSLDGYLTTSSGSTPLVDRRLGGSVQMDWALADDSRWFTEATVTARDGYYGRKSLYSVVYTDHDGVDMQVRSVVRRATSATTCHQWELTAMRSTLANHENLWNEVQEGGGLTRIAYYAKMQRLQRSTHDFRLAYDVDFGASADHQAAWHVQGEAAFWMRDVKATFFPTYRKQEVQQWRIGANAGRHIGRRHDALDVSLGARWQWGGGTMADDGVEGGGEATTHAVSLDRYLAHEFDYLTARQWSADVQVRYSRPMPRLGVTPYATLDYGRWQATSANVIAGDFHQQWTLRVGCEF